MTIPEQTFLESHISDHLTARSQQYYEPEMAHVHDSPPYMETHLILYDAYRKLPEFEYFQRAWCLHELRMGRQHIFLVPCESDETIFRLPGHF
jgi:hypothetical protein